MYPIDLTVEQSGYRVGMPPGFTTAELHDAAKRAAIESYGIDPYDDVMCEGEPGRDFVPAGSYATCWVQDMTMPGFVVVVELTPTDNAGNFEYTVSDEEWGD